MSDKIIKSSVFSTTSTSTTAIIVIAIVFIILIVLLFINSKRTSIPPNCVLKRPQNVSATSDEKGTIVVGWDRVKGAREYKVLRSCQLGFAVSIATNIGVTTRTSFVFNNVNDTNNYIKVIASSSECDDSRPSKEIQIIINCTANEQNLNVNHIDDGVNITKIKWIHISNVNSYRYQIIPYKDGDGTEGTIIDEIIDTNFPPVGNEIELSFNTGDLPINAGENYFVHIFANNQCGSSKDFFLFIK